MSIQLKAMPFDSKEILDESTGETSYDRVAYSKDLADWLRSYFSNGILIHGGNTLQDQLKVVKKDGVKLGVKPGAIVINGRTGWVEKEEELTVDVGGTAHRIDRIVAELNIPSDRGIYLKVLKGNPSSNPSAPSLTTTEDVYQIPLAQVRVNAGAAVIAEVTDERANHISNVLIGIKPPTGNDASAVAVSDTIKSLYGLTSSTQNVEGALETAFRGGILNALMTGFSATSETGAISGGDTLKKALNKLQNNGKIVYGSYTGREKETVDTTQWVSVGIRPDFLIIVGGSISNSTFYGQVERTAISIREGFISIKSGYQIYKPYFEITSNGFTVSNFNRAYMNQQGYIYRYIAIQV